MPSTSSGRHIGNAGQLVGLCLFSLMVSHAIAQPAYEDWPRTGLNLEWQELMYWTPAIPFNNLFKIADPFVGATQYDASGYPLTGLPATSNVYQGEGLPKGTFTLKWAGEGSIKLSVNGTDYEYAGVCPLEGVKIAVNHTGESHVHLTIGSTQRDNHVRDLRFYLPGYDDDSPHPFNDCFLSTFQSPIDVLRMVWWARVPNSDIKAWEDRPRVNDYTYGGDDDENNYGTAYEHIIDICNVTDSHLYMCVPVMANDDFVTQMATLIRDRLDDSLYVFVEYSNESPWNYWPHYHSSVRPAEVGLEAFPGDDGDIWAVHKYAARASEIMQLFDDAFGSERDRLIGVLGGQSGYTQRLKYAIDAVEWLDRMHLFDAFSPAPYIMNHEQLTSNWPDMDALFNELDVYVQDVMSGRGRPGPPDDKGDPITDLIDLAEQYGKKVIAYEAGQHYTSWNTGLTQEQVVAVSEHPRMYNYYLYYTHGWFSHAPVTSTIVFLSSHTNCPTGGSCFGVKRFCDQPIEETHRYRAILDWFNRDGKDTTAPTPPANVIVSRTTDTSVSLQWDAASDNLSVGRYIVYQDGQPVDSTGTTRIPISGLASNIEYSFYVTAEDIHGNESAKSNTVEVTTHGSVTRARQSKPRINAKYLESQWDAWWITHPQASLYNYEVLHFRKHVDLPETPDSLWVHVSADNRYELYINGKFVCHGPARGDFRNWFYESVDIAPFLKSGRNCIAALVWNGGEYKPMAQVSDKTAFILQGDDERGQVMNTDASWRVYKNEAYHPIIYLDNDRRLHWEYYVAGALDSVEAENYPWGWKHLVYDDSQWHEARQLDRPYPAGENRSYHHRWMMAPRQIPLLTRESKKLKRVARTRPPLNTDGFIQSNDPITIPPHREVEILFDNGLLGHGYPELTVSQGRGSRIKMRYAEKFLLPDRVQAHRDLLQEQLVGIHDEFIPDGGDGRRFRPLWTRTFRWLQLEIKTGEEPLVLDGLGYQSVHYPTRITAEFDCDDPMLLKIWDACINTQILSAQETFVSDLYWEQIQYVGDTMVQGLTYLFLTGDETLFKLALKQMDDSRVPNGLTQSRYPCNLKNFIASYSLMWISMLHDYYMYGSDPDYVFQFMPGVTQVLGWYERHETKRGFIPSAGFTDWSYGPRVREIKEQIDDPEFTVHTLAHAYTLQQVETLFRAAGMDHEAERCQDKAQRILAAVRKYSHDEQSGLFTDAPGTRLFSQHTNIMAVLAGAKKGGEARGILSRIVSDKDIVQVDMFSQFYLGRAMRKFGLGNDYLQTVEKWESAIDMGMQTFGEAVTEPRSECHAWSTSPALEFLSTICGIESTAPGFSGIEIRPFMNNLTHIRGKMKHPAGMIEVDLKKRGDKLTGWVSVPQGIPAEFVHQTDTLRLAGGKQKIELEIKGH